MLSWNRDVYSIFASSSRPQQLMHVVISAFRQALIVWLDSKHKLVACIFSIERSTLQTESFVLLSEKTTCNQPLCLKCGKLCGGRKPFLTKKWLGHWHLHVAWGMYVMYTVCVGYNFCIWNKYALKIHKRSLHPSAHDGRYHSFSKYYQVRYQYQFKG